MSASTIPTMNISGRYRPFVCCFVGQLHNNCPIYFRHNESSQQIFIDVLDFDNAFGNSSSFYPFQSLTNIATRSTRTVIKITMTIIQQYKRTY